MKPHGKPGGIQRTPLHAYDKAANQDLYNVQDIIAERQEKGVPKYLVRWEGFGPEDDTWEPIEHLAGAEEYIARFVEERNAAAKRSEEEHAAKRAKRHECAEQQSSQPADNDVPGGSRSKSGEPETIKRKTSWVWQAFTISLLAMINRRLTNLGTNVCYPWTMVQNVTLYWFIVEVQLIWQPISEQGTANMSLSMK